MKYRATYDAKNQKLRIFVDDLPANQYEFARIKNEKLQWRVTVVYRLHDHTNSREAHNALMGSLADLRKELDALDATRYKELSFISVAN